MSGAPVPGAWVGDVAVGHWTDPVARTGTTVVVLPPGTVASGEVRGGAPGTREWALLDPAATVDRVDAVVLTGGSAPALAACDGVVARLRAAGRGWPTAAGPVPIVVGLVLYDLAVGSPISPGPDAGAAAWDAARPGPPPTGAVGAGTGATTGTWRGLPPSPGGVGAASATDGAATVAAVVAVNALGDLRGPGPDPDLPPAVAAAVGTATTIGVVLTDAELDKRGCHLLARAAHDGLARAVEPAHTAYDGDAFVAAATGRVPASLDRLRILVPRVVEAAIRQGVAAATG